MERNSFDEVKSQVQKNARELEALKEEVGKLKAAMKEQKKELKELKKSNNLCRIELLVCLGVAVNAIYH